MNRSFESYFPSLGAASAALIALFWTAPGETFDPSLAVRELPAEVVANQCLSSGSGVEVKTDCIETEQVTSRWIGRTGRGDLFMVLGSPCAEAKPCRVWFVERRGETSLTLLRVSGEFRLYQGDGVYPTVQQRNNLSETHSTYSRYEWRDGKYVRTEQRIVYRAGGVECDTRSECTQRAQEALQRSDTDSAVKILQDVYGVSWI